MKGLVDNIELTQMYMETRDKMDEFLVEIMGMEGLHRIEALYTYHTKLRDFLYNLDATELNRRAEKRLADYMGEPENSGEVVV